MTASTSSVSARTFRPAPEMRVTDDGQYEVFCRARELGEGLVRQRRPVPAAGSSAGAGPQPREEVPLVRRQPRHGKLGHRRLPILRNGLRRRTVTRRTTSINAPLSRLLAGGFAVVALAGTTSCGDALRQPLQVLVDDADRQVEARSPADPADRKNVSAAYMAFLPPELRARPGDKAFFSVRSRGEPHSIALGTLINQAAQAIDALPPEASLAEIEALPEMQAIPSVFPLQPSPGGEEAQVNSSAADPCYLDSDSPPNSATGGAPGCERRSRPPFTGRQSFYNSGVLGRGASFTLSLATDTQPGTYNIMCLIHRSQMRGTLKVLERGASLPTTGDFDKVGDRVAERIGDDLAETADHAAFNTTPEKAVAGAGLVGVPAVLTSFGQKTYEVPVGGSMSWSVYGMHTITFDAPGGDKDLFVRRDGRMQINPNVWRPSGSSPVPPLAQAFGAHGSDPILIDGGSFDGRGTHHSGLLRSFGAPPVTYRLTFPKAGTYSYSCLIHTVMAGKVRVG